MIDRFIKYTLRFEYQVQGRYFIKDGYEIYRPNEKDVDAFTTVFIFPLETPPLCDQQGFLEYLRTQLDKLYKPYGLSQAKEFGAIAYTENMYSSIEPIRWQDLTEAERLEHLGNLEAGLYDEAQTVIRRAANVFRKIQQLDSGAPDPLLGSQTPAPDTAPKNAAQPPAVDAEQTAPPKPAQLQAQQAASNRTKGGRPSQEEIDNICFAIIEMFLSYQNNKTLNNIKELDDAVEKINRRLSDKKCGIKIDVRRLDGDKIPGRLFRYLWRNTVGVFEWGYTQDKLERDKKMADEYINRYKRYKKSLK